MQATWRVEMLGGMRAVSEDATISKFRTHNVELLLAMLAIKPGHPLAREVLGERLWPGEETPCQLERLRYVKSRLGAALRGDPFEKSGNLRLAFRPDAVGSDVAEFDAALLAAEARTDPSERLGPLRTAAELYRGELLPGFYDDWSCAERDRLREARFDVLSGLVRDLEAMGRLDEADPWRRTLAAEFPERSLAARPAAVASPGAVASEGLFFGRDAEREAVIAWFDRGAERVLTLVGPGGMGKTRLAREATAGRDAAFVSLAELTDAGRFFEALHGALGLSRQGADLRAQTLAHLRASKRPFLILDNLEQVAEKIGPALRDLLRSVPGLRLLATSRKRLNLTEERVFALNPLPGGPSVALFLDRACRLRPDFAQTPESRALVGEICALLEGLPLAIELAAARTVVLGPAQIRAQLARRLSFLVNRRHAPVERHRSLRAALDWSIELLSPEQQRVFARLSVFRGGFTLEQAEAVAADPAISTLNALDDLHAHSLLSVRFDESGEARYDLLVVIREYAEELLQDSGESERAAGAHYRFFVEYICHRLLSFDRNTISKVSYVEKDNISLVVEKAIKDSDDVNVYLIFHRFGGFFLEYGMWADLDSLIVKLDDTSLSDEHKKRYFGLKGGLLRRRGEEENAEKCWIQWLDLSEKTNDREGIHTSSSNLALQQIDRGDVEKAERYASIFYSCRESDRDEAAFLVLKSKIAFLQNRKDDAIQWAAESLKIFDPMSNIENMQSAWVIHAISVLIRLGNWNGIVNLSMGILSNSIENGNKYILSFILMEMGIILGDLKEYELQEEFYYGAMIICLEVSGRFKDEIREKWKCASERCGSSRNSLPSSESWESLVVQAVDRAKDLFAQKCPQLGV